MCQQTTHDRGKEISGVGFAIYYSGKQALDSIAVIAWQLTYLVVEKITLAEERSLLDLLDLWAGAASTQSNSCCKQVLCLGLGFRRLLKLNTN